MNQLIQERIKEINNEIPEHVKLVAISKFHPAEAIASAYEAGQRIFGESRAQELQAKQPVLPADIQWHFIGHLQPNKVKYIAPYISMIHAVDNFKLLTEIDKQARKHQRVIPCLLQLHVAQEESKFGFSVDECREFLREGQWRTLENVQIAGIMCMASNTDDESQIHEEFHTAYQFYLEAKKEFFADDPAFCERSWGMSHDYPIAIEEGCTMVRVGSKIFGARNY